MADLQTTINQLQQLNIHESSDVIPGSYKKAWWKCPKGNDHIWQATIEDRNNGTGCPICSNKKVVKSNCLATLNPTLAKEWHPTKNNELTPDKVTSSSGKKSCIFRLSANEQT